MPRPRPTLDELINTARPALLARWTSPKNHEKGAPIRDLGRLIDETALEMDELLAEKKNPLPLDLIEWEAADVANYALMILAEVARRRNEDVMDV